MGGDDLGVDDDYFLEPVVAAKNEGDNDDDAYSNDDDVAAKRALNQDDNNDDNNDDTEPASKKPKKLTNENVLIEAGCGIESRSVQEQVSFLTTSLQHYSMLEATTNDEKEETTNDESTWKLTPKHMAISSKQSLGERLRDVVSLKRLKKHRQARSPAVVIVCQSARRAVAVLKELNDLRLRVAKLFPKNAEVPQQVTQLRQSPFPLAVGTPHRLVALAQQGKGLSFEHTQLVVLDTCMSKKQYTVCTLPDTAADTMTLLREHVLPEMKTNKNLRIAFL